MLTHAPTWDARAQRSLPDAAVLSNTTEVESVGRQYRAMTMKEKARFTRAWFAWRRLSPPIERFRGGHRNSPVYDLECALDHLRSSVSSLGEGYLANREVDFAGLAPRRTGEAERIGALVASADIPEAEKKVYRAYLTATCEVLEALRSADVSPWPAELLDPERRPPGD